MGEDYISKTLSLLATAIYNIKEMKDDAENRRDLMEAAAYEGTVSNLEAAKNTLIYIQVAKKMEDGDDE